jgi:hypothetical protein
MFHNKSQNRESSILLQVHTNKEDMSTYPRTLNWMKARITPTRSGLSISNPIRYEMNPIKPNGAMEMTITTFETSISSSCCGMMMCPTVSRHSQAVVCTIQCTVVSGKSSFEQALENQKQGGETLESVCRPCATKTKQTNTRVPATRSSTSVRIRRSHSQSATIELNSIELR